MTKASRDEKTLDIVTAVLVLVAAVGAGAIVLWLAASLVGLDDVELQRALLTAFAVLGMGLAVAYLLRSRRRP